MSLLEKLKRGGSSICLRIGLSPEGHWKVMLDSLSYLLLLGTLKRATPDPYLYLVLLRRLMNSLLIFVFDCLKKANRKCSPTLLDGRRSSEFAS